MTQRGPLPAHLIALEPSHWVYCFVYTANSRLCRVLASMQISCPHHDTFYNREISTPDEMHVSINCQQSDALKIHIQQLQIQYDTIQTLNHDAEQFYTMWFNTVRSDTIWKDWAMQRNDMMQCNEFYYLLINGLSNKSWNERPRQKKTIKLNHYSALNVLWNAWNEKCALLSMCSSNPFLVVR